MIGTLGSQAGMTEMVGNDLSEFSQKHVVAGIYVATSQF